MHQPRLRYCLEQAEPLLDLSQQQETTIGSDIAAIEPDIDFAASELGKGYLRRGKIWHRRNLQVDQSR